MTAEQTAPKFDQNGLIPAIVQDVTTKDVLMVAYMNEEALNGSLRKFLNDRPIVVLFKLVAVAPQVKESRFLLRILRQKLLQ